MGLPQFQCHKQVGAARILSIGEDDKGRLALDNGENVAVTLAWLIKHEPVVGGYLVEYADGYQSYSPAGVFEAGYSPVEAAS